MDSIRAGQNTRSTRTREGGTRACASGTLKDEIGNRLFLWPRNILVVCSNQFSGDSQEQPKGVFRNISRSIFRVTLVTPMDEF
jgi:hypothetical protein